jgi:ParB-like chromosome segregation protein Spo0J
MDLRAINEIIVGDRHRKQAGDIAALAQNIDEIGLLHPVVIDPAGHLIAGARRLMAFQHLGRTMIPTTVVDLQKLVLGEYAENAFREAFTPTELVSILRDVESIERALAKERQKEHGGTAPGVPKNTSGNFPEVNGRALDKIGKALGKDRKTIQKMAAVVEAAEADPEKFGKLQADMDRTGRADGPFKRLKVIQQSEEIRKEPPPLPGRGPYRVIVADPPWQSPIPILSFAQVKIVFCSKPQASSTPNAPRM